MTPDELAKSGSEHAHQRAFFAWCAVARLWGFHIANLWAETGQSPKDIGEACPVNVLEWIFAIPNGGSRGDDAQTRAIRGGMLKAEGVKSGVADIFLPFPIYNHFSASYHGLFIEMKKPAQKGKAKGSQSPKQIQFEKDIKALDYGYIVCYSWREAANVVQQYIGG